MSSDTRLPKYSPREELANSITHGVGILLSMGGLALPAAFAARFGDVWHLFVLGGSTLHFFAITLFVIPAAR